MYGRSGASIVFDGSSVVEIAVGIWDGRGRNINRLGRRAESRARLVGDYYVGEAKTLQTLHLID